MRWSIIRLIWLRELRDQLRDRRTMFMIVILPILLYPVLGIGVIGFALTALQKPSVVGVMGAEHLPQAAPRRAEFSPYAAAAWLASGADPGLDRTLGAAALAEMRGRGFGDEYPPLLAEDGKHFLSDYFGSPDEDDRLEVTLLPVPSDLPPGRPPPELIDGPLKSRDVDLILLVPPDFRQHLQQGGRPRLFLLTREGDDLSRLISVRVESALNRWQKALRRVRLVNQGLPADFDEPVAVIELNQDQSSLKDVAQSMIGMMARIFPFLLVIWSLTGALYPAVDLCAGEQERGTMETLLISPASREEIVYGKFLTIWVFSGATALLNLASIGLTTWFFSSQLPVSVLRPGALAWCVLLLLPLSAF